MKTNESNPLRLFHCFTGLISRKIEADDKVVIEHDYTSVLPNDDENTAINEDDYAKPDCELEGTGTDTGSETGVSVQYKKNAVDFWRNVGGKQRKFSLVQRRFKKLKRVDELYRWETQVESGGTKAEKLKFITKETYEDFKKNEG